jgi:hypothetical protein
MTLAVNRDIFLNSISQMIIVMVKGCAFFEVWTKFLNIICMNFSFEGLSAFDYSDFSTVTHCCLSKKNDALL